MSKQNMYEYNAGKYYLTLKEKANLTCYNMDDIGSCHVKQDKAVRGEHDLTPLI